MDNHLPQGVIDVHAHVGPDSIARSIDALDLARLAKSQGMRGIVMKNHFEPTASLAYLVRKEVPGIEIFGGITLNLAVGGMNPAAVEHMATVAGDWGRLVWLGSFDTENQVRYDKRQRPFVSVARQGELLPEVKRVIEVISKHRLIMATGHSTPEENLMLIHEARQQGVAKIVVTHAMMAPIHMSIEQMCEAASLGAFIEFVYNGLVGPYKEFEFADYAQAIRGIGPSRCVLASDLGQPVNPLHPDGLVEFFAGLIHEGISQSEIECISKQNPEYLLGVSYQ
jgi:hypothetical protein